MPAWMSNAVAAAITRVPALLTLALLAGLGLWGSLTGWKLPRVASFWGQQPPEQQESPDAAVKLTPDTAAPPGAGAPSARPTWMDFPSAEAVRKAGIRWVPVEVRPMAQYVNANGMVDYEPSRYAHLAARAAGAVWWVADKETGDRVDKGEVLALIDAAEVGKAKADFLQSLTQFRLQTITLERLRPLYQKGATPERTLVEAETALRAARTRLLADQQALLNLGLPLRLKEVESLADDQVAQHLRLLGLPDPLRKEFDSDTLTANLLPLTAPFDGQVVERSAAPGEVLEKTQPKTLFVVGDVSQVHLDLNVNVEDMPAVRLGQPVTFQREGEASVASTGTVSHISPEVDEKTRRVRVHAEVPNPGGRLRPNTFGTGHIRIQQRPQALVVPAEAVQSDGKNSFVFVRQSDTRFQARPVGLGLREGGVVEVSGVRPGEEVVTTGSFALKSELLRERITGDE